jgi:hypothetical protein
MKAIFLLDISTADGKYLEHFVFDPGTAAASSTYIFSREKPTRDDWATWIDFWHSYTTTGGKLKTPLGNWKNAMHRVWKWHYKEEDNNLQQIEGGRLVHFKPAQEFRLTRSTITYWWVWVKKYNSQTPLGRPTSVRIILSTKVNKLQEGPRFVDSPKEHTNF